MGRVTAVFQSHTQSCQISPTHPQNGTAQGSQVNLSLRQTTNTTFILAQICSEYSLGHTPVSSLFVVDLKSVWLVCPAFYLAATAPFFNLSPGHSPQVQASQKGWWRWRLAGYSSQSSSRLAGTPPCWLSEPCQQPAV